MPSCTVTDSPLNLFSVSLEYALAHCVSADCVISNPIAQKFKDIYGRVEALQWHSIAVGGVAVKECANRQLYYLVTKEKSSDKCTYSNLQSALETMLSYMQSKNITKVAMPRIGYIEDLLDWNQVKQIIENVFSEANKEIDILICQCEVLVRNSEQRISIFPRSQLTQKCVITEVKGTIFSAPTDYSLAHSVAADMQMIVGIGLLFKHKFGHVDDLLEQNQHTGGVAVLKSEERFIYYLVTKEDHQKRATYGTAILSMREHMRKNNVRKLAIPHIGCGIDQLSWLQVSELFRLVFFNDEVDIIVYYIPPFRPRISVAFPTRRPVITWDVADPAKCQVLQNIMDMVEKKLTTMKTGNLKDLEKLQKDLSVVLNVDSEKSTI